MAYTRYYVTWHDWPNVSTPATAAAFQHIEDGILAASNTRIIFGQIDSAGNIEFGSGYSVVHTGTGKYKITFDSAFSGAIATSILAIALSPVSAVGDANIPNDGVSFGVIFAADQRFQFIAVGN